MTKVRLLFISFLLTAFAGAKAVEREFTVTIEPGKEDCFYEFMKKGATIDVDYQVVDGGHGELDISFHVADPKGRILVTDFKKSENNHRVDTLTDGDYRFCFDNTFSSYNSKTVFFEIVVESEDDDWNDENVNIQELNTESSGIKIEDFYQIIVKVRNNLSKARHLQDFTKSTEAKDRNVMEDICTFVNTFSMIQLFVMLIVGAVQILMIRSLFDESAYVHKLWKKLKSNSKAFY